MNVVRLPSTAAIVAVAGLFLPLALSFVLVWLPLQAADDAGMQRLVLVYSTLPRLATALIAGAALSLAGALFQHVLRNPLASPSTLGVSAGAHLALVLAMLFFPATLGAGRDIVALAGSALAALIVIGLGARRGFSPLSLVLSGLVVSLWCGALAALLTFLHDRFLASLFIWGAGSLSQQGWDVPLALLWKLVALGTVAALLVRPLSLIELGEESASALGVRLALIRFLAVTVAVALSAMVTSAVGVIGFIGLVAPAIARLAGVRRLPALLLSASLIGALLLFTTDALLQFIAGAFSDFLPTGAVTAIFASPLLLVLLHRLKAPPRLSQAAAGVRPRRLSGWQAAVVIGIAFVTVLAVATFAGRAPDGQWAWMGSDVYATLAPLRLPRVLAALSSGAMLALAGVILQRLTGNEMASPEVLGISAGATFGLALSLILLASPGLELQSLFATCGAFTVLAAIIAFSLRSGLAPEKLLLAGIALGALVDALSGAFAATGDPRALQLLRWMAGSTYEASAATVRLLGGAALLLGTLALLARRWLDLLPLGSAAARALGLPLAKVRLTLFLLAGLLGAAATLGVGPLSFVGLMAPHLAREAGLVRALPQMTGAALIGGLLMVLADWLGRMLLFPYQVPAGLMAALVGAPFLVALLLKRR